MFVLLAVTQVAPLLFNHDISIKVLYAHVHLRFVKPLVSHAPKKLQMRNLHSLTSLEEMQSTLEARGGKTLGSQVIDRSPYFGCSLEARGGKTEGNQVINRSLYFGCTLGACGGKTRITKLSIVPRTLVIL